MLEHYFNALFNYPSRFALLFSLLLLSAIMVSAQSDSGARLRLDQLDRLEDKAQEVIEVTIDGKMLDLAKRVLQKVNDKDAQIVGAAIVGLEGIYVRVFNFEKDNQYSLDDVEDVRTQLRSPKWESMVNVRSKKKNEKINVFTRFNADKISGLAVVISDVNKIAVVNVVGSIDIEMLAELSGRFSIPKIEIEKVETEDSQK